MKWSCEVIQDLLPLYQDGCCSEESRRIVEEHLGECEDCRSLQQEIMSEVEIPAVRDFSGGSAETEKLALLEEKQRVKKSFRKIRGFWHRRIAAAIIGSLALFLCVVLGVCECLGTGIAFSNLDDIRRAQRFLTFVQKGEYEKAARMMDYTNAYRNILEILQAADAAERYYRDCFTEFTWNNKKFVIEDSLKDRIVKGDFADWLQKGGDPWLDMIRNQLSAVIIPEEIWEREMENFPADLSPYADHYVRVEWKWGAYYMSREQREELERACRTDAGEADIYEIYRTARVMPLEIYREAEEDVLAEDRELARLREEHYGVVRNMTQEEYTEIMRGKLVASLREWESSGGKLLSFSFASAYRIEDCWEVNMRVLAEPQGEWQYWLSFKSLKDGIYDIGAGHLREITDRPILAETLHVYFSN